MGNEHATDLERRLALLAQEFEFPPTPDLAEATARRVRESTAARRPRLPARAGWIASARRPLTIALAGLLLTAAAAFAASPGLRDAVLDAFGIGGVSVERRPELPPIEPGAGARLGERIPLAEARARADFGLLAIPRPSLPGPDATHVREVRGTPIISLAYGPQPGLPASPHTGTGLVFTQFRARLEAELLRKIVATTGVERVRIAGHRGYWFEGAKHVIGYRTRRGSFTETARLAGNTLVWQRGPITLRLEGEISKPRALRIARSVR